MVVLGLGLEGAVRANLVPSVVALWGGGAALALRSLG